MRITIVTGMYPPGGGGAERATEMLARGLTRLGHAVTVVTTAKSDADDTVDGVRVVRIGRGRDWIGDVLGRSFARRISWNIRELIDVRSSRKTFARVQSTSPELVISGNIKGLGGMLPRLLLRLPAPHVHVAHDFEPVEPIALRPGDRTDRLKNRIWIAISKWRWGSPELVVFPSAWLRSLVASRGIFPASKTIVITNPIARIPSARPEKTSFDGCRLLFIGQLEPHKGALWLVRGLRKQTTVEDWTLDIVGDGGERGVLERISNEDGRVRVHGRKEGAELDRFWNEADALVVPSRGLENAPLVILEATARRVPILAASVGGIPESVFAGENGWTFDADDEASFVAGLKLVCDASARQGLAWSRLLAIKTSEEYAADVLAAASVEAVTAIPWRCVDCGGETKDGVCVSCGREYCEFEGIKDFLPLAMSGFKKEEARYHDEVTADAEDVHQLAAFRNRKYHEMIPGLLHPVAPGGWTLELACGSGHDGAIAVESGQRLIETDVSLGAVRVAKRRLESIPGPKTDPVFAVVDAEALPFTDSSLAGAFMTASLHHAEDSKQVLREVKRVLVPGAAFVTAIEPHSLYFGALNRLKPSLERLLGKRADKSVADEEHAGFTRKGLVKLFRDAGFDDVRVIPMWFFAGWSHYSLEFLNRLTKRQTRLALPEFLERAVVGLDEIIFLLPGGKHLAWHWIAVGKK